MLKTNSIKHSRCCTQLLSFPLRAQFMSPTITNMVNTASAKHCESRQTSKPSVTALAPHESKEKVCLVRLPETRPIILEQLIAEVKSIYVLTRDLAQWRPYCSVLAGSGMWPVACGPLWPCLPPPVLPATTSLVCPHWPRLPPWQGGGLGTGTRHWAPALAVGIGVFPSLSVVYKSIVFAYYMY